MTTQRVLISILNWNKAEATLACLDSLRQMDRDGMSVEVLVIDNGSEQPDHMKLISGVDGSWTQVLRLEKNLGFTGGHNVSLKMALEKDYDFVWLLNNDATVEPDTLSKLVAAISAEARCGAVSPVIRPVGGVMTSSWGFVQDWKARNSCWAASEAVSMKLHQTEPERIGLAGTAILFRVQAIRQVGLLDDRLFAYFDDNDISARLARGGWRCKVVFDAVTLHPHRALAEQPLYFVYLMYRNELIFWHKNMPKEYRRFLWLRLLNQSLYNVNRLYRRGLQRQGDVALLGVWDFMRGAGGAPQLARKAPMALRLPCRLLGLVHQRQLRQADVPALPSV